MFAEEYASLVVFIIRTEEFLIGAGVTIFFMVITVLLHGNYNYYLYRYKEKKEYTKYENSILLEIKERLYVMRKKGNEPSQDEIDILKLHYLLRLQIATFRMKTIVIEGIINNYVQKAQEEITKEFADRWNKIKLMLIGHLKERDSPFKKLPLDVIRVIISKIDLCSSN